MIRFILAAAALLFAAAAGAAPLPAVDALLSQESVQHRADGVTQTFRYQERFLRVGDDAWLERVLPADIKPQPAQPGEHGPNLQTLPRWMHAAADGAATLTLVDRGENFVVAIKPPEFGRLGFGGRWATERSLIDPASLAAMKPMARPAGRVGARWFEAQADGRYSRVLWSEALQFPLAIETGTLDGRESNVTRVELRPLPKVLPWSGLETFRVREVDDFGD